MDNQIGEKIAILRKTNNFSQNELARKLCVSNKTISKWECGNSIPDVETLKKLADIFHVSIDYFVNDKKCVENNENIQSKSKINWKLLIFICVTVFVILLTIVLAIFIPRKPMAESVIFDINTETSTMSCVVNNSDESFSFNEKINVPFRNTWKIYSDINATQEITSNVVELQEGNNTFYLLVTNSINDKKLYTIIIRRKPMYTISFNSNGGTIIENQIIEEGKYAVEPNAPTKTGYTFVGWDYLFTQEITNNKIINALWQANTNTPYKIEYYKENVNDTGYTICHTTNCEGVTDSFIETPAFEYEHFTHFTSGQENGIISADGTTIFKHYYKRDKYKVEFNLDGGYRTSGGSTIQMIKYEASAIAPVVSKNGYNFEGYDIDFNCVANNTTITVLWSYCTFTTNTNKINAGTYTIYDNQKITENTLITLVAATNNIHAYKFLGWYNGNNLLVETQQYQFYMPKENITYTAKWKPIKYTISYQLDKGVLPTNPTYYNCESHIELTEPEMEYYTFSGWFNGTNKITEINNNIFENLNLVGIWENDIFNISNNTITSMTQYGKTLTQINIENMTSLDNITEISFSAFNGSNVEELIVPFVGQSATENTFLGYIFGADSYTKNKDFVPSSLDSIKVVTTTTIPDNAFYECNNLKECIIGKTIQTIGSQAFAKCCLLESIIYESNTCLVNIEELAFYGCQSLTIFVVPKTVEFINGNILEKCDSLIGIQVESENDYYDSRNNCNAIIKTENNELIAGCQSTIIPNTTILLGLKAFSNCLNLEMITIPASITSIGNYCFASCTNLEQVIFNSNTNLISIGQNAFASCSNLVSVILPDSVQNIGTSAFYSCTNLESIYIGKNLNNIGSYVFNNCYELTNLTYNAVSCNDIVQTQALFRLAGRDSAGINVIIGDDCQYIPNFFFRGGDNPNYEPNIISIVLGENLSNIGAWTFPWDNDNIISCLTIKSQYVYNNLTSLTQTIPYTKAETIKVLKTIDTGTNQYLNQNFTKSINDSVFNIYNRNN